MMSMEKLTLKEIEYFGGTQEDLELLKDVDERSEDELTFSDSDVDHKDRGEIRSFIESLGLNSGPAVVEVSKDEKKKPSKKKDKQKDTPKESYVKESKKSSVKLDKELLSVCVKPHTKLFVSMDTQQLWYNQSQSTGPAVDVSPGVISHLTSVGAALMQFEMALYEKARQKRKSAGDLKWLKTVLSAGTLTDKMAARTLLIQESPVHTSNSLDSLLTMAGKKGKRECVIAVDALKELWLTNLLPDDRKLKSLKQRPLNELVASGQSVQSRHSKLLLWYYEDQLKTKYAQFLAIIKGLLHDTVANIREKALGHVFDLLYRKPEQEKELLSQLVNKMGDPVRKIASKATLFLLKLLNHHVNMKVVVATELERLLHRPNIKSKAQYYCVCCLNQFTIAGNDHSLAAKLIDIYFTFFKLYVKRGELDAKMLGALLTGVNRAFPFLKGDIPSFEDHMQSLFTVVHVGPLATGIQSLLLLYQVMESRQAISGRYYQALYAKLMDPALKHSGKQGVFLNLLFKSVKSDPEVNRVKAFLKRILQIATFHSPSFLCGCLYLISEILKHKSTLWSFILQPEANDDEHFVDTPSEERTLTSGLSKNQEVYRKVPNHMTKASDHMTQGRTYQMIHRNPQYCGAGASCLWELNRLTHHYHPSVQVFANKIASGSYIDYKGDPLQDFTTMHFLDRFVYKNPKQKERDHGGSLMQKTSKLLSEEAKKDAPVNSAQFASLRAEKVREDELFMHTYFIQRATLDKKATKKEREEIEIDGVSNVKDMDFASELEKQVTGGRQVKKRKGREDSDGESMDDFDSDIDEDSLVGNHGDVGGDETTEAEMERMLLEQLSSDSEGEERPQTKKQKISTQPEDQIDMSSMFAAAEEFSHLLEDGGAVSRGGEAISSKGNGKQLIWEGRNAHHRKVKGRGSARLRTNKKTNRKVKSKR